MASSTLITVGFALLIQLGLAVWTAAKLVERVDGHHQWLKALETKKDEHETRISTLEGALR